MIAAQHLSDPALSALATAHLDITALYCRQRLLLLDRRLVVGIVIFAAAVLVCMCDNGEMSPVTVWRWHA